MAYGECLVDGYFVVEDGSHEEVSGSGGNGRIVDFCPVKRVWFGVEEVYVCMDEEVDYMHIYKHIHLYTYE